MVDNNVKFSGVRRYNYTSNMLIKSENYLFDNIDKGIIDSGNLEKDIEQSVSSIKALLEKYHDRHAQFSNSSF